MREKATSGLEIKADIKLERGFAVCLKAERLTGAPQIRVGLRIKVKWWPSICRNMHDMQGWPILPVEFKLLQRPRSAGLSVHQ
jgi:hypothetical protein